MPAELVQTAPQRIPAVPWRDPHAVSPESLAGYIQTLEQACLEDPRSAGVRTCLGMAYAMNFEVYKSMDALEAAVELAPDDSKTQLHFARALADAGMAAESKAAMDRFRQLGPVVNKTVPGGLVDYLALSPEQRRADYRMRLQRAVREHPEDAAMQVAYINGIQRTIIPSTENRKVGGSAPVGAELVIHVMRPGHIRGSVPRVGRGVGGAGWVVTWAARAAEVVLLDAVCGGGDSH